ncbi:MAG: RtcB family protein [Vicinamibacterales bacterium]
MTMKIFGQHDERTQQQLARCVEAEHGAVGVLCADGHLGYSMPIGGVVGYRQFVSPSGVGYDIACGNMAVQTNIMARDVADADWTWWADEIQRRISFGIGRKNNEPIDSPIFDAIAQSPVPQQRAMLDKAHAQLGTVGSGNHYVDVLVDEAGVVWIACHFGSRGFGHMTATGFMSVAKGHRFEDGKGEGEMDAPPLLLPIDQPSGQDYIAAMELAGRYAYAGREAVIAKVLAIIGAEAEFSVHNHHNFAWEEEHDGETYWVVRKGATPAFPGQFGFVGGSMGDISVILAGKDTDEARAALRSTVHGAGRVMSRTQAAGKQRWVKARWTCRNYRACDFFAPVSQFERGPNDALPVCPKCGSKLQRSRAEMRRESNGLVDFDAEKAKLVDRGIILRGAGADEAPPVYRPLRSVLDAHAGTIEIVHTLTPRIVVMAGGDEFDPYKD